MHNAGGIFNSEVLNTSRYIFLVLKSRLHDINRVGRYDVQDNSLACERLHKRAFTKICTHTADGICNSEVLKTSRYTSLVLNFRLHDTNRVGSFDFQGDSLASERFHKGFSQKYVRILLVGCVALKCLKRHGTP